MAVKKKAKAKKAKPKAKAKAKVKKAKKPVGKSWSAADIKKLRSGYKATAASQLAKELKRTLASVRGKISALGLTKGPVKKKEAKKAKPKARAKTKAKAKARPKKKVAKRKVAKKRR